MVYDKWFQSSDFFDIAIFPLALNCLLTAIKFNLIEKHTKFERNLPHGFDKSADLLSRRQNHEEDFFKL